MTALESLKLKRKFAKAAESGLMGAAVVAAGFALKDLYQQGVEGLHLIGVTLPFLAVTTAFVIRDVRINNYENKIRQNMLNRAENQAESPSINP